MGESGTTSVVAPEIATALTAEERRERRRAKILAASDKRLQRILSGPDGTEKRLAPCLDGGEGYRMMADSTTDEQGRPVSSAPPPVEEEKFPSLEELGVTYEPPRFFTFVRTARCKIVSVIAILFFILSSMGAITSVLLPWTILFVSYTIVEKQKDQSPFPNHGYIVNALMWAGFSEEIIVNLGFLLEGVTTYLMDTSTLLFVYILSTTVRDTVLVLTA